MTLTKAELTDLLFDKVGLNKRVAKDMVDSFFEVMIETLESGGCVKLARPRIPAVRCSWSSQYPKE